MLQIPDIVNRNAPLKLFALPCKAEAIERSSFANNMLICAFQMSIHGVPDQQLLSGFILACNKEPSIASEKPPCDPCYSQLLLFNAPFVLIQLCGSFI